MHDPLIVPDFRYRLLEGAWLLLAFGAPLLLALVHFLWVRRGPHRLRRLRWLSGGATVLALLTVTPFAWLKSAWTSPPAGESDAARALKKRAVPVVRALAAYREAIGHYPDSLGALEPRFLQPGVLPLAPAQPGHPVRYVREGAAGDRYALTFGYEFNGYYQCRYTSDAARWSCTYHE